MVEIGNLCLEADNKNEVIHSKVVFVKAIDATTLLGMAKHQMTFERKKILENPFSEEHGTICEHGHSDSKQLLGDGLAHNVKKAKAAHSMNQPISNMSLRLSCSSLRNPTNLYSSNSKASTSTTRWDQKQ